LSFFTKGYKLKFPHGLLLVLTTTTWGFSLEHQKETIRCHPG